MGTMLLFIRGGVLHHTGKMWEAITNASNLVNDKGDFYYRYLQSALVVT
jgi:hypothetical protein